MKEFLKEELKKGGGEWFIFDNERTFTNITTIGMECITKKTNQYLGF